MANTFELISSVTVGVGGAASIDFTVIPNTYTDLAIVASLRTDRSNNTSDTYLQFNGDTGANYSFRRVYGSGTGTPASDSLTNQIKGGFALDGTGATATGSTFSNAYVYIPNYTSSYAKSFSSDAVTENNATGVLTEMIAGLWTGTSAITSIKIQDYNAANFVQYSTAYLYGVKNA